jgi:cytochrome c6
MKNINAIFLVLVMALAARAAAQSSAAKDLFAGKCATCHAADGSASSGIGKSLKIPSFHSPDVQNQPDAELKAMILKGKGAMPTFAGKLSDAQIDQMVGYIRTLGNR